MNDGDSSLTPIDLGASYRVLCEACGVLEFSDRTRLILSGDDRQSFLHNLNVPTTSKNSREDKGARRLSPMSKGSA
ncbi:MAG: hypothetical protein CMJ80_09280 [Planctomycetaceae bacterium]|nr:hypothetical protein [Planctomycetaceae bacterium]